MLLENFLVCLNAILPVSIIIAAGYGCKCVGVVREEDIPRFNAVIFNAFMPVMCFYNLYMSDLSSSVSFRLALFAFVGILVIYALSVAYAHFFVRDRNHRSVVIQGLFRSNYLILGLSIASGILKGADLGVFAILAAVVAPMFNILAVITLQYYCGEKLKFGRLLLLILKNPLILGNAAGVVFLLLGIRLPFVVESAAASMAQAASPVMLFLMGAFLRFRSFKGLGRELVAVCLGRLIIIPALALSVAVTIGFRDIELLSLVMVFGSSNALASFTMVQQMGGDADLAGNIVVTTLLLCTLTLFGWCFLFKSLNLI